MTKNKTLRSKVASGMKTIDEQIQRQRQRKNITLISFANKKRKMYIIRTGDGSRVVKLVEEYITYTYGRDFWNYYMRFYRAQTEEAQVMIQNYTIYDFERNRASLELLNYVINSTRGIRQPMIVYRNFTGLDLFRSISLNGRVPASASLKRTQCEHIPNTDCIVIYLPENSKILPLFMYYQYSMKNNYNYKPKHIEVLIESKGILVRTPYITPYITSKDDGGYPIFYYSQDGNENLEHIPNLKKKIDNWLTYPSLEPTPYPYSIGYTLAEQQAREEHFRRQTESRLQQEHITIEELQRQHDARMQATTQPDARMQATTQHDARMQATTQPFPISTKAYEDSMSGWDSYKPSGSRKLENWEEDSDKEDSDMDTNEGTSHIELKDEGTRHIELKDEDDDIQWEDDEMITGGKRRKLKLKKNRKKITRRRKSKKRTTRRRTIRKRTTRR